MLLILDNHETHASLAAIDVAKENGVILLTLPPKTSHKLQLLDVSCYKPFKTANSRAMDNYMRSHPGKAITIYDIPEFVSHAQLHGLTAQNIVSGFQRTGIYPFNQDVFCETEFEPAAVTDRDLQTSPPSNENLSPGAESTDNFNVAQNSSALFGSQKEINEESLLNNSFTQEALSFINVDSASAGPRGVHISPADIIPLPRAGQRRVSKKGRKKRR